MTVAASDTVDGMANTVFPFDPGPSPFDNEGPEKYHPYAAPPVEPETKSEVQTELAKQLQLVKDEEAALPAVNPYEPEDLPRIVDGIVVPAQSVADYHSLAYEYTAVSNIGTVRVTGNGVGAYLRSGKWLLLWQGPDIEERDRALVSILTQLSNDHHPSRGRA